jgi:TonB-dependent SusC/RagA subfamily outer membrane receptor
MKKLFFLLSIAFQSFGQKETLEQLLKMYFHSDRQQISIQGDTLWVVWHEPADKANPFEFRDTSAIPLKQIQDVKFIRGRNAAGKPGIGLQLVPYQNEKNKQLQTQNVVDNRTLNQVNAASTTQKLQGQVSGVSIGNDNSPGGASMVRIRGIGSINANSPLYIVDGVPLSGNINSINPNDIASVTVLKDPAQTAMYGVRGANGVIVISTIKGGTESKGISEEIQQGIILPITIWSWGKQSMELKKSGNEKMIFNLLKSAS